VTIPPEIRSLRRLLYLAEWIESHALHIYLLHAPDFLGYESAISLAADHPQLVERALRLKKSGNDLIEVIAGRATSPVSLCVGGFCKTPCKRDLLKMRDDLAWALEAAKDTATLAANLPFPQFEADYEFVALADPNEYAICAGRVVSSRGLDVAATDYEKHFTEVQVGHSTALHSVRRESSNSYFVGPLARLNLHRATLTPQAAELAATCGIAWPSRNPFHGIVARGIELVHACEESIAIIDRYEEPQSPRVPIEVRQGEGCSVTEAPRGMLYHFYRIDRNGLVEQAKIIPPTAQNLQRIEDDLRLLVGGMADKSDAEITARCESLVRSYDPCISCSTHFLRVRIER
jgi:sulfhydrogenase subunit alpha